MSTADLAARIAEVLQHVRVLPRRMLLETPSVRATIPMLRGVWGAALHDLDPDVYHAVFAPNKPGRRSEDRGGRAARHPGGGQTAAAGYVLRPAPPDPGFSPALEWILIGDAIPHDAMLCRAWDVASGMGLGNERRRFHLRKMLVLQADGTPIDGGPSWRLSDARWPVDTAHGDLTSPRDDGTARDPTSSPSHSRACRLCLPAPLRLIRQGRLIESPTLADIIVAACRRVRAYLPATRHHRWDDVSREALEYSRSVPSSAWQGHRLDLHRYSATQRSEVDLRGVSGSLDVPQGPGELGPLLAASRWLHLGKGTVMGLGELRVEPR